MGLLKKFVKGAAGEVAEISREKARANIIEEKQNRLAEIEASRAEKLRGQQLEDQKRLRDEKLIDVQSERDFVSKENALSRNDSGKTAAITNHERWMEEAQLTPEERKQVARNNLGLNPQKNELDEYVRVFQTLKNEQAKNFLAPGDDGYRDDTALADEALAVLKRFRSSEGENAVLPVKKVSPPTGGVLYENHPVYGKITEEYINKKLAKYKAAGVKVNRAQIIKMLADTAGE